MPALLVQIPQVDLARVLEARHEEPELPEYKWGRRAADWTARFKQRKLAEKLGE